MLQQICHRGQLLGYLKSNGSPYYILEASKAALTVLCSRPTSPNCDAVPITKKKHQCLPSNVYDLLLDYIRTQHPHFRYYKDLPHPLDAHVFSPWILEKNHIIYKTWSLSTFSEHSGNSSIGYYSNVGTIEYGLICSIWVQSLGDRNTDQHTFLLISPHEQLSNTDRSLSPYSGFPGFQCVVVYMCPPSVVRATNMIIIRLEEVISQVASYDRAPGTFGIKHAITILIDSLHCNRN